LFGLNFCSVFWYLACNVHGFFQSLVNEMTILVISHDSLHPNSTHHTWSCSFQSVICIPTVETVLLHNLTVKKERKKTVILVHKRTIPSDRHLSAKLVPTFADRGCCILSTVDPYGRILGFLDRGSNFFFRVALILYSLGRIYPTPDQLLLRKSAGAGNQIQDLWICSQELWPLDHRGGHNLTVVFY
jgi:hypothetical protein